MQRMSGALFNRTVADDQNYPLTADAVRSIIHGAPFDSEMKQRGNTRPFLVLTGKVGDTVIGPVEYRRTRPDYNIMVPVCTYMPLGKVLDMAPSKHWRVDNVQHNFKYNSQVQSRAGEPK